MANKWHEIWNRRKTGELAALNLEDLIALDGFDSGAGKIEVDDWREYARRIADRLNLKDGVSIYEVGCGCGAFLFALCERFELKVGGNDYGAGLIETAQRVFPGGDFKCVAAAKIDPAVQYDYVISNSVFHYFDLDYARIVLLKMVDKAGGGGLHSRDPRSQDQNTGGKTAARHSHPGGLREEIRRFATHVLRQGMVCCHRRRKRFAL